MIQGVKGTKDIYGKEIAFWLFVENNIREICQTFSFKEVRTPIFEYSELFVKGTGDNTDIVQKEMYTFTDKGKRNLTLKPEVTPPIARVFLEHKLYANTQPTKIFSISPCFRYEQPQAGRMRQFHQFDVEYFGCFGAAADAEIISLAYEVIQKLGIKNTKLYINSLGTDESRQVYNNQIKDFLAKNLGSLCPICLERIEKNPLRVLDCKEERCQKLLVNAPSSIDSLDTDGKEHFQTLQEILTSMNIPFEINPKIVRGLDYYNKTVFEFICEDVGAQSTICGGGRYDNMIKDFGGEQTGAIGFAMGMERLILAISNQNIETIKPNVIDVFIGSIGQKGFTEANRLVYSLRKIGIIAETDTLERSVKAQLKFANKIDAKYSTIIGDDEMATNTITLRNMETGEQIKQDLKCEIIANFLQKKR